LLVSYFKNYILKSYTIYEDFGNMADWTSFLPSIHDEILFWMLLPSVI
jgi:hypothetical protein